MGIPARLGPLGMADEVIALRDASGREHRVVRGADGRITIGEVALSVQIQTDGTAHVSGDRSHHGWAAEVDGTRWVFLDGHVYTFEIERGSGRRRAAAHHGSLMAPMPATVRKVQVRPGDTVARGDVLILLEAMKMELPVRATSNGRVTSIACAEGDLVQPGVTLIEIEAEEA